MDSGTLTLAIKAEACRLGFDWVRVIPVQRAPHWEFYQRWLTRGSAGEMAYLERNLAQRALPAALVPPSDPALRSMVVLAVDYHQFDLPASLRADPSRGLIAAYAWGDDYHELIRPRLHALDGAIRGWTGRTTQGKCLVDTGPILERDWAHRAGIGFTGKNCCTIRPGAGSWLFLATVTVPERLVYDPPPPILQGATWDAAALVAGLPPRTDLGRWQIELEPHRLTADSTAPAATGLATCGACTRCLAACPTAAFVGPFHLDPRRCISYWTIEARSAVPRELRPLFANRIFGCDICQEVCPWNQRLAPRLPSLAGLAAHAQRLAPPLLEGFRPAHPYWLEDEAFRQQFRRSPVKRAGRVGMLRNVCVALGNWASPAAVPALAVALAVPQALVREHAAWALGRIGAQGHWAAVEPLLSAAASVEAHVAVRAELTRWLA